MDGADENQRLHQALTSALERRLAIIADHTWRDSDPDSHLTALKDISETVSGLHGALQGQLPARLDHFLKQCSYAKALEFLQTMRANETSID